MKYTYLFPNLDKNSQFSKTLRSNLSIMNNERGNQIAKEMEKRINE